jgi:hypothetical protein
MFESDIRRIAVQGRDARAAGTAIPYVDDDRLEVMEPVVCLIGEHGRAILYHPSFAEFQVGVDGDPLDVAAERLAAGLERGLAHDLAPWQHNLLAEAVAEIRDHATRLGAAATIPG